MRLLTLCLLAFTSLFAACGENRPAHRSEAPKKSPVTVIARAEDAPLATDTLAASSRVVMETPYAQPAVPTQPVAGDRFFMALYAFDGLLPRLSHMWGVFFLAPRGNYDPRYVQSVVISWSSYDGDVGVGTGREPGRLYSFEETLALAHSFGSVLGRTPIVEIRPELFFAAADRQRLLLGGSAAGAIDYRFLDSVIGREGIVSEGDGFTNCNHAVSDIGVTLGMPFLRTGFASGLAAAERVYDYFGPFIIGLDPVWEQSYAAQWGL